MTQVGNAVAAIAALALATLAGVNWSARANDAVPNRRSEVITQVVDASGNAIPVRDFQRIVSASTVADGLLVELVDRRRVLAFTSYSVNQGWQRQRFAGAVAIDTINDVEAILNLKPDLVLANLHGSEQQVARLREAGIAVFNLGEMRGVAGFLNSVRALTQLLQIPVQGQQYSATFSRRLQRISDQLPEQGRKSVAYVAVFGSKLYGSGRNTNYADVFHYAGVIDRGAEHYENFPEYGAEQVLQLDPDLIVAREGTQDALCRYPGLAGLRACRDPMHSILELPEAVISSAGPEMLLAAEAVHDFAYGSEN
ncbi:MAG TPA: helical backbone metal receptor [Polyangiaceae bacterium]|nr:helical backbone metal receptor [Polyangiaceae bacterium]